MVSIRTKKFICMGIAILLNAFITVHPPEMGNSTLWHIGIRALFTIWVYVVLGMVFFRKEIEQGKLF